MKATSVRLSAAPKATPPAHSESPRAFIVIPAYNEGRTITRLLGQLEALEVDSGTPLSAILVNDGSTDDTLVKVNNFQGCLDLVTVNHVVNQGVPRSFYDGFATAAARCRDEDYIVVVEGDGTSDLQWIPRMSALIQQGADLVIASRFVSGGGYLNFPWHRTWGSFCVNYLLRLLLRLPGVTDYTIFFRAYRAGAIKTLLQTYGDDLVSGRSFAANLEILLKLQRHIENTSEVPLKYDYSLKGGPSSMRLFKTLFDYSPLLLKWYRGRY